MQHLRMQGGLMAAASCLLVVGACDTPDLSTNLRPAGDPEVLSVLVLNDADSLLREGATYCADDVKAPRVVGLPDFTTKDVCGEGGIPLDDANGTATAMPIDRVHDAVPQGWYVRIMFDELLDPDVETLTDIGDGIYEGHIDTTLPVTLSCGGVEIAYDGYYVPNGNNVTWPLGPSLVVFPLDYDAVATGIGCQVSIKDVVVDKDGNQVPTTQRGPFAFDVAPLMPLAFDPEEGTIDEEAVLALTFNHTLAPGSLTPDEVSITEDGVDVPATIDTDGNSFLIAPVGGFAAPSEYVIAILETATVADIAGGPFSFVGDASWTVTLIASPNCGNGDVFVDVDGVMPDETEACDDGNLDANDGCSGCVIDDGFDCIGEPSVCTAI